MHLSICSTLSVESKCHDKPFVTAATTLSYRRQLPDRKTSTMMKTKSRGTTEYIMQLRQSFELHEMWPGP